MILFINACVRKNSRTRRLADCLLNRLKGQDAELTEVKLEDCAFPKTDEAFLARRDQLIADGSFDDPLFSLARQFAEADTIVIAAPYYDLSFPAALKQYLEQINVVGLTFRYTPEGTPEGLCRAGQLYYVTTAGGAYVPEEYGFGYVKALAQNFYGISEVQLIQAAGLDLYGADPEAILAQTMRDICTTEPEAPATIYLAGGCFWGMQKFFDQFDGVLKTEVGYANGPDQAPTYQEVCSDSGHAETLRIDYDPAAISLTQLLEYYFMVIDPLSVNQQGHDRGIQYRTGIYYISDDQLPEIQTVYQQQEAKYGSKLAVELEPLRNFFSAEEYHQKYLDKNPGGYCHIPSKFFNM